MSARPPALAACSEHAAVAAGFACDSCGRRLCADCVREGHRLLFCRHCGERALPLAPSESADPVERRRRERVERPYSFGAALAYVTRADGRWILAGYVVVMSLVTALPALSGLMLALVVWLLVPGLLFEIVRTTAEGATELPDWPDVGELWSRVREWVSFLGAALVAIAPIPFSFRIFDVSATAFLSGQGGARGWIALAVGVALGLLLALFAFGATGAYGSGWLWFRLDLHLEAWLGKAGGDALIVAGLGASIFLAGQLAGAVLGRVPIAGAVIEHALSGYALFTGAHLVGLVFRRHAAVLDPIYRD